jgi:hypothetical protein
MKYRRFKVEKLVRDKTRECPEKRGVQGSYSYADDVEFIFLLLCKLRMDNDLKKLSNDMFDFFGLDFLRTSVAITSFRKHDLVVTTDQPLAVSLQHIMAFVLSWR